MFFSQEQAHKTVLEISLPVPLLISPLHEGIHNHGYLLDLQSNKSASKDQRETCQIQILKINRVCCSLICSHSTATANKDVNIFFASTSVIVQLLKSIFDFKNGINVLLILYHFSTWYHVIMFFIIIHSHCHRADR